MDVLNIISWIKGKRQVTAVDPALTVIPLGVKDNKRGDGYIPVTITVEDFAGSVAPTLYDSKDNIFIGENVFNDLSDVDKTENIAIGTNALRNTVNAQNIGIGSDTLRTNTEGFQNIAIGNSSLLLNTTGENNIGIGVVSMLFSTTSRNNVAIGSFALFDITTGRDNVAVGLNALGGLTTGSYNTGIGYETYAGNYSSCVLLGRRAQATGNNQFVVGSVGDPAGSVTNEVNTSSKVWNVVINGVSRKILLA